MTEWITVIIPAHNEENYIARCIRSVQKAAEGIRGEVGIIVVCNRCTDMTAAIAERCGVVSWEMECSERSVFALYGSIS